MASFGPHVIEAQNPHDRVISHLIDVSTLDSGNGKHLVTEFGRQGTFIQQAGPRRRKTTMKTAQQSAMTIVSLFSPISCAILSYQRRRMYDEFLLRTLHVPLRSNPLINVHGPTLFLAYVPTISKFMHLGNTSSARLSLALNCRYKHPEM